MHRNDLKSKLEKYQPTDQTEIADKSKMLIFLEANENCFERSLTIGHFTGSCWLENYDGTKFLLTLHKKIGLWLQLGGHADGNSDIVQVAMKEAHEESGLKNIEIKSADIFDLSVHLVNEYKNIPAHYHYDVRFLLKASDPNEHIAISEESTDLRWFSEPPISRDFYGCELWRMYDKWKETKK
ncbi:MAG: NUDIX hydrolase [Alphaproteobacteria bacterium]|nr:NUDIX hydrolase [Alphaproteobacteria bacterium]